MSISLVVTNSIDRDYNETGEEIDGDDWKAFVDSDPTLAFRTGSITAPAPDGSVISMKLPPGHTEYKLTGGILIPFLSLTGGELTMPYHPDMEDSTNPVRLKVAEIARHFAALITSDAGDDFLDW